MRRLSLSVVLLLAFCAFQIPLSLQADGAPGQDGEEKRKAWQLAKQVDGSLFKKGEVVDDALFLRRLMLDLLGTIPTVEEIKKFEADPSETKRRDMVDELIDSDAFEDTVARYWSGVFFGNFRKFNGGFGDDSEDLMNNSLDNWLEWFKNEIRNNVSWLKIVGKLIATKGSLSENPEVLWKLSFHGEGNYAQYFADRFSRTLLGLRITCAQCHDHPFDRWTQEDYWGLAAFLARARTKPPEGSKKYSKDAIFFEGDKGEVSVPGSGMQMKPKFIFGGKIGLKDPRLLHLANFTMTSGAKQLQMNVINRTWWWLIGRGFVEPLDQFSQRKRPLSSKVMGQLRGGFSKNGSSLRFLYRAICYSKYYQRSYANGSVGVFGSGARQLTGEQLAKSLLTGCAGKKTKKGFKAIRDEWPKLRDQLGPIFGIRSDWTEITVLPGNTRQTLMMRNSAFVQQFVRGGLSSSVDSMESPDDKIHHIFLSLLSRRATEDELGRYKKVLEEGGRSSVEDIIWTVVNSAEFATRH